MDKENKLTENKLTLKSTHIFLFPFEWSFKEEGLYSQKTNLSKFQRLVEAINLSDDLKWQRQNLSNLDANSGFNDHLYNEYSFYYDFVRDALYDFGTDKPIVLQYELPLEDKECTYTIDVKNNDDTEVAINTYELSLKVIKLNIYKTGVGVLSFHLENYDYSAPLDVQLINQFGRRIYPPFIGPKGKVLEETKNAQLASNISVRIKKADTDLWSASANEFNFFDTNAIEFLKAHNSPPNKELYPAYIHQLLPEQNKEGFSYKEVLDDRMFVISWFAHDNTLKGLQKDENGEYQYDKPNVASEDWYKLVFVDGHFVMCHSDRMFERLMQKHTYDRWLNLGTIYGFSRYSLMCLTTTGVPFYVVEFFNTIYLRMVELALVQRASVLHFSDEVNAISKLDKADKTLPNRVQDVYWHYIQFINKIYFKEITAEEQGIEIYDLIQDVMKVGTLVESLDKEIADLNSFASAYQEERRNDRLEGLTVLASAFLVPSLSISILSLLPNIEWTVGCIIATVIMNVIAIGASLLAFNVFQSRRKLNQSVLILVMIVTLFLSVAIPFWSCQATTTVEQATTNELLKTKTDGNLPNTTNIETTDTSQNNN